MRDAYRGGATLGEIAASAAAHVSLVQRAIRGITYSDVPGWVTAEDARRRPGGKKPGPLVNAGRWMSA